MNPRRKSRLYLAIVVLLGLAVTITLVLYALRSNIDLFIRQRRSYRVKVKTMRSLKWVSVCVLAGW